LTDGNQNIQSSTIYDAWGNILQSSGTITNPYLYVGELGYYGDGDAGMYLLTQRWYNPTIGRFVVRDPLKEEENLFNYGLANPLTFIDPTGLYSQTLPPGWIGCHGLCNSVGAVAIIGGIVGDFDFVCQRRPARSCARPSILLFTLHGKFSCRCWGVYLSLNMIQLCASVAENLSQLTGEYSDTSITIVISVDFQTCDNKGGGVCWGLGPGEGMARCRCKITLSGEGSAIIIHPKPLHTRSL
jgi:RHS repeat-associated protein